MKTKTQWIVFEGLDGVGKSTLIQNLQKHITEKLNLTCKVFRMPNYEDEHALLSFQKATQSKDRLNKSLLMLSSTLSDFELNIKPFIGKVDFIILDRFYYSTFLYQVSNIEDPITRDLLRALVKRVSIPQHHVVLLEESKTVRKNRILKSSRETDASKDTYDHYTLGHHQVLTLQYQEVVKDLNPKQHLIIQGQRRSPNQLLKVLLEELENKGITFPKQTSLF